MQVWGFNLPLHMRDQTANRMSGFNMLELIIVMSIVSILAMIAIPSFKYVTSSNRVATEVNSLLGDMQYARNEAVKEGQTVTVCASANPTASLPSCSGSTSWQTGWIVFSDPTNSQTVPATNAAILRVQTPFTGTDTFTANDTVQAVSFNREGFASSGPIGNVSAISGVLIKLHDSTDNSQWTRCLSINATSTTNAQGIGMLATEKAGTGQCS